MNKNKIALGLVIALGALSVHQAEALDFSFSATGNSKLQFQGRQGSGPGAHAANFSFINSTSTVGTGFAFQINTTTGASTPNSPTNPNSAVGDFGNIFLNGGSFSIGTSAAAGVTSSTVPDPNVAGGTITTEHGAVTTTGTPTIKIVDKSGGFLTANVVFDSIDLKFATDSHGNRSFNSDGISGHNPPIVQTGGLALNLTSIVYTHVGPAQADLTALASADNHSASITVVWAFNGKSLTEMTANGGALNKVSFSGDIQSHATVPDGGMTLVMLGTALSGLVLLNMKRQMA